MTEPTKNTYAVDQRISTNAFVSVEVGGQFYKVQVTARHGAQSKEIVDSFNQLVDALSVISKQHPVSVKQYQADKTDTDRPKVSQQGGYQPKRADSVPARLDQTREWFVDDFSNLTVTPLPDGKATIEFWKDGLQYSVFKCVNWKAESVVGMIGNIKNFNPKEAKKYGWPGQVIWSYGREYQTQKGETRHYKNVAAVLYNGEDAAPEKGQEDGVVDEAYKASLSPDLTPF